MYTIISPLCDKWKVIGLQLGLRPATLEAVDKSYDGRTDRCLYSVLTKWLQRRDDVWKKGGVTWSVLIQVLKSVGADETVLSTCRAEAVNSDLTSNIIVTLIDLTLIPYIQGTFGGHYNFDNLERRHRLEGMFLAN